ncbi:MAG: EVE domain-containing protein [Alphaproteobacteria bacterium]
MAYWWLNTNRKIWTFDKISEYEQEPFLLYNDNGRRRNVPKNFDTIKKGDLIIGYESTPTKKIVALCECSYASNGESIGIKKISQLQNPVRISEIEENENLKQMQFIKVRKGTLFEMTPSEYNIVLSIIKKHNRDI